MVQFKLTIRLKAESEAQMVEFLTFLKDNHATEVIHGSADSESFACHSTIILSDLTDTITAVQAFKQLFTISYKLEITA